MFIDSYYTSQANNRFLFTKKQASDFAKKVAHDFNPIHDEDNSRFCVPGDLLFSKLVLTQGLYSTMKVKFTGMVGEGVELAIKEHHGNHYAIVDADGKEYLDVEHLGEMTRDTALTEKLVLGYVQFSGEGFLDCVVKLMADNGVMVHPSKPLVMYDSMTLVLDRFDLTDPQLEFAGAELEMNGKRGKVFIKFIYRENGEVVGHGEKTMILSGLRPYEKEAVDGMVTEYRRRMDAFFS